MRNEHCVRIQTWKQVETSNLSERSFLNNFLMKMMSFVSSERVLSSLCSDEDSS